MRIILIILAFIASANINAQGAYEKGMTKAFDLWKNGKQDESINMFERIARAEKENWLPFYYAAQVHIITCFNIKDETEVQTRLKKAQDFLNEAKIFSKENAEILVMEAMLNTAYVVSNPSVYGPTLSGKVEELYRSAKGIDPENPRATLYHAEWKMGGAKFWGKDPKDFCPEVEKAILYFEKESKNETPFYPKWGKDQITRIQENCK
ncbi:hypothetical protein [Aquimarina spongiae]|uniref:Tetratricopeptide repeat-containing protein n=1 Tax=Aquimarina spongiae TaxID=570521 RepID=A0A1M6CPR3_9FLAO|nr:hypothetical protein [Aquimarina spongiae]SHI63085.1 hypothetical protein SAMN04488508_102224 [Aquimarina spongiae]